MAPDAASLDPLGGLTVRPLRAEDGPELTRIHRTPEVSRWWADPEVGFPWDEPESTRWTVALDGSVVGLMQFWEETEPRYRHAAIDMFLDPAHHGRGLGTEVMRRTIRHLIEERGHHRITIDPAADNAAAVRCYEKAGFTTVGRPD